MTRCLLCFTVLLLAFSCKKDESTFDHGRIYSKYYLNYDASTNQTTALASFSDSLTDGEQLDQQENTAVYFDDDELEFDTTSRHYTKTFDGFRQSGTFKWTDDSYGITYKNTAAIEVATLPDGIDTLRLSSPREISWAGNALADGEEVYLSINGEAAGDVVTFTASTTGSTSLTILPGSLVVFKSGRTAKLQLTRIKQVEAGEKTAAGGEVSTSYSSNIQQIIFSE